MSATLSTTTGDRTGQDGCRNASSVWKDPAPVNLLALTTGGAGLVFDFGDPAGYAETKFWADTAQLTLHPYWFSGVVVGYTDVYAVPEAAPANYGNGALLPGNRSEILLQTIPTVAFSGANGGAPAFTVDLDISLLRPYFEDPSFSGRIAFTITYRRVGGSVYFIEEHEAGLTPPTLVITGSPWTLQDPSSASFSEAAPDGASFTESPPAAATYSPLFPTAAIYAEAGPTAVVYAETSPGSASYLQASPNGASWAKLSPDSSIWTLKSPSPANWS